MKSGLIIGLCLFSQAVFADGLPVITVQPASQIVSPGGTATLTVTATGAASLQWRFNGTDIPGATSLDAANPERPDHQQRLLHGGGEKRHQLGAKSDGLAFGGLRFGWRSAFFK
jgi:hypothetical protein